MVDKRGEEVSRKKAEESRRLLFESANKKIIYYLSKSNVEDIDLYYVVKDFFREFLELKYEFSLGELIKELDKIYIEKQVKDKVILFINEIKRIEYTDVTFKQEDIKKFLQEFSSIVKSLGFEEKKEVSFFAKIFGNKNKREESKQTQEKNTNKEYEVTLDSEEEKEFQDEKNKIDYDSDINNQLEKENKEKPEETKIEKEHEQKKEIKTKPESEEKKELKKDYYEDNYDDSNPDFSLNKDYESEIKKDEPTTQKVPNEEIDFNKEHSTFKSAEEEYEQTRDKQPYEFKDEEREDDEQKILDFEQLIGEAKAIKDRAELINLYKQINKLYETLNTTQKAKVYEEILEIYKRISTTN